VVATAVGEVPSVIQPGRTGVLVPPGNPESLAAAIVDLLKDAAQRERLGSAARRLVENGYSAARMTTDYLRVYEEAISVVAKENEHGVGNPVTRRG